MTVREVFEASREAAIEMRMIREQAETRREAIGVQGHDMSPHPKTSILDPSRKIIELMEWEAQMVGEADLERPVDEANELVVGMGKFATPEAVELVTRYYLFGESWGDIIHGDKANGTRPISASMPDLRGVERKRQERHLACLLEAAVEDCESVGIPHLKRMARDA